MKDDLHRETYFEQYITKKLNELAADGEWQLSENDTGFDPNPALYLPDFVEYLERTQPEKLKKMKDSFKSNWEANLTRSLVKSLEIEGTVQTIRNGFNMAGYATITCSGGIPDDPRISKAQKNYDDNILRVMRQVHYQTAGNKSLDLVFFINGIPVATAEVKTDLTQTVQDAIEEYQNERKPIEPDGRRKNFLLMYKRGAVVHFAISESEVWMYAGDLGLDKPKFLPFNKGNNGHEGNPPMDENSEEYPTGYFWNEICQKENWIRIFHNFIFEEVKKKEDATGRLKEEKRQLFPRYHQWDVVTKVIQDIKANGVGQKYLIEHSAGSGKTETISWISHELIRMMNDEGKDRLFSSVIVVTDRLGLDTNIKGTIKQLKKTVGLIEMIGGDETHKTNIAKSKQLATAIKDKREIIVVTLQTFPFALEAIANEESLKGCKFAVLIDEAHNSQDGTYSGKMKAALKLASDKAKKTDPDAVVTDEDLINAYFSQMQSERVMPDNVSFFAFTATPKHETMTIFGRDSDKIDEKTGKPIPVSFHLYPMRQAIEEGYILDVLKGYIPYKTAYKLKEDVVKDKLVDERKAVSTIAKWASLHPTNVMEKTEFIIEHFCKNVAPLLDGNAKAMIVTSSRPSVIRYKYAIMGYLKAHPELDRANIVESLQFKVPGEPLVAFSGNVPGEKCVMPEDFSEQFMTEHEYLKDNPFAYIKKDYDYSEANMNNLGYETVEQAFDTTKNRILIVANKFQVGFNQPKLCAMYVDKSISNDIEIVQTYSRLNRIHAGKEDIFIVDFVNDPEKVFRAFKKYDNGATMEHAQSLDVIYDIKKKLDEADIYTNDEFEEYKKVRYASIMAAEADKNAYRKKFYKTVETPAERWKNAYKSCQTAYLTWKDVEKDAINRKDEKIIKQAQEKIAEHEKKLDSLSDFKKKLKRFHSAYSFISQVIDLEEPDLEVFDGFTVMLHHRISDVDVDEIDIKSLVLSDYRINPLDVKKPEDEDAVLRPMGTGGQGKSAKRESLKKIISKINEIWGDDVDTVTGARTVNAIADYVAADDVSRIQIRNSTNSKEAVIADGRLESIIKLAAVSLKNNEFAEYADKIISDPQTWRPVAEAIFDLVDGKKRIDIPDLIEYTRNKK